MLGVVRKEEHIRYIANLAVNGHPHELGAGTTKIIAAISNHSKIARTNILVGPHPIERLISHCKILLEDGPEGYTKYVREI